MWIGKYVEGSSHDIFEELCGLEHMMEDDVMTKHEVLCRLEQM
jgi:hypothetical protein